MQVEKAVFQTSDQIELNVLNMGQFVLGNINFKKDILYGILTCFFIETQF
ncbi:hypothetical protein SDC9_194537 [bioreactor metagenome]|uniref:Uncharacterized protein n=1 Tax=bioreactor metagenome TaxID=1076179 RepID=A0A645I6R4_9ZZZZ